MQEVKSYTFNLIQDGIVMKKIISLSIIAFFFIIYLTCYLSVVKADPPVTATQNVSGDSITQMPTSRDPWAVNSLAP